MIVVTMIMINLFVGIICDTMAAVGEEEPEDEEEEDGLQDFIPTIVDAVGNVKSKQSERLFYSAILLSCKKSCLFTSVLDLREVARKSIPNF